MAQSKIDIKISLSTSFLESLEDLPKSIQKKTREFLTKFQENPLASSINYETIANASNEDLRSVRIDQAYRGIVLKPKTGNTYFLLWVAKHDDAYNWALTKRVDSREILGADYIDAKFKPITVNEEKKTLLRQTSIVDLVKLGIPLDLIDSIRDINEVNELEVYKDSLNVKVYLKLQYYLNGYNLDKLDELVDINDEKENPFIMIEDLSDSELIKLINSPISKWRLFLHPTQLNLANRDFNGSAKVIGSAGTGKTVVALHRAKHLYKNLNQNEKILLTTYTRTLAEDLKEKISEIIKGHSNNLEVLNLDNLVIQFFSRERLNLTIVDDTTNIWNKAINYFNLISKYSVEFIKDEWEMIILAHNIVELDEYLIVPREYRSKKVDRASRLEIWNIVEKYKNEMNDKGVIDYEWAKLEAIKHLNRKHPNGIYRNIILDEAQDMSTLSFKLVRALAGTEKPNDIFIVGDSRQRIYKNKTTLKSCGIKVSGNSYSLNINYRTTDAIYEFATNIIKDIEFDDLDGEIINSDDAQSVIIGNTPIVSEFLSYVDEIDYISKLTAELETDLKKKKEICICLRTNELVNKYADSLKEKGVSVLKLSINQAENQHLDGVRITTMHRVKGLEFSHIIIAGLNEDTMPLKSLLNNLSNDQDKEKVCQTEKSLLYVAMTRARYSLTITSSKKLSSFVINYKS